MQIATLQFEMRLGSALEFKIFIWGGISPDIQLESTLNTIIPLVVSFNNNLIDIFSS